MTPRLGPTSETRGESWRGRRNSAEAFRTAAERLADLHEEGENANPILLLIIHAAIAYGDALTDKFGRVQNRKDHQALANLVDKTLGARAEANQIQRLRRIIGLKDEASYGAKIGRIDSARKLLENLQSFGDWANDMLEGA